MSRVASRAQVLGFSPSLCFVLWSRVAATNQDLGGSISHTLISHPHVPRFLPGLAWGLVCPMVRVGLAQFATTDPAVRPTPPFLRLEGSRYMSPTGGGRTAALAPVVSTGPGATSGNFKKLDVASASFGGSRHADASSRLILMCGLSQAGLLRLPALCCPTHAEHVSSRQVWSFAAWLSHADGYCSVFCFVFGGPLDH